jgi:hypothetical protein
MRNPAVTENIMLDGVNEASPGWLAPAGEHRAPPLQHEWTRQMPSFSILTVTEFCTVPL